MYNSNDYTTWNKYPKFQHVYTVEVIGTIFPKDGTVALDNKGNILDIDPTGHKARIHTNNDLFAVIDDVWVMVRIETIDFITKSR